MIKVMRGMMVRKDDNDEKGMKVKMKRQKKTIQIDMYIRAFFA